MSEISFLPRARGLAFTVVLLAACAPDNPDDACDGGCFDVEDPIAAGCHWNDWVGDPVHAEAGLPRPTAIRLRGPRGRQPFQYEEAGEPAPGFRVEVVAYDLDAGDVLPTSGNSFDMPGWTEVALTPVEGEASHFNRAFDFTPPHPGSWVIQARVDIPGVTDTTGICGRGSIPEGDWYWVPDPRPEGWVPQIMLWIEAE
jgi:hypothetical protein